MAQRSTPTKSGIRFNPLVSPTGNRVRQQPQSVAELQATLTQVKGLLDEAKKREAAAAAVVATTIAQPIRPNPTSSHAPSNASRYPADVRSELASIALKIKDVTQQIDDSIASYKALQNGWSGFDDDFKVQAKEIADKMARTRNTMVSVLKDLKARQLQIIEDAEAKILVVQSPKKGVSSGLSAPMNSYLRVMNFIHTGNYTPPPPTPSFHSPAFCPKPSRPVPPIDNEAYELDALQSSMRSPYPSLPRLRPMEQAAPPRPVAPSLSGKRHLVIPPVSDWDFDAWSAAAPTGHAPPALPTRAEQCPPRRTFADTWNVASSAAGPLNKENRPNKGKRASVSPVRRSSRLSGDAPELVQLETPKRRRRSGETAIVPALDPIAEYGHLPALGTMQEAEPGEALVLPDLGDEAGFEPIGAIEVHPGESSADEPPQSSADSLEDLSAVSSGSEVVVPEPGVF